MDLCGININCHSVEDLIRHVGETSIVVTVNAETIVRSQKDKRLKGIVNSSLTTIDGQIPLWLYKLKYGKYSSEKVSGSELIYLLPKFAVQNNLRVFLLGGKEDSNAESLVKLRLKYPMLKIEGYSPEYSPYPFSDKFNNNIIARIRDFSPDILFVGFGMGKQEYWASDNFEVLKNIGVKLVIGCGGSFEFASGKIKRAPKFIQNIGLEGIWRLAKEFKWFRIKRLIVSSKIFYYYLCNI